MNARVSLRLDEETLRRIRHLAADQRISVSEWITELVTQAVTELDGFESARRHALRMMKQPAQIRGAPLTREQSHRR